MALAPFASASTRVEVARITSMTTAVRPSTEASSTTAGEKKTSMVIPTPFGPLESEPQTPCPPLPIRNGDPE